MTSPSENESESRQIDDLKREIDELKHEQTRTEARVRELLLSEDPSSGTTFHADIFRLQQDKLRMDTEIQFLKVKLRRLQSSW